MHDQPVLEPFEASSLFANGAGSRSNPEGTVARGQLHIDTAFYKGVDTQGQAVRELPVPLSRQLLDRGRSRYEAFCAPCHDRTGSGQGMIVRRGFKQPSSFHEDRLLRQPVGYFFNVIGNGFGQMSSYAAQIETEDRWAIAAYIRALQWSRRTPLSALPPELRSQVLAELDRAAAAPETEPEHGTE
jgi:mono/diheme cytochrome c family protein